MMSYQMQKMQNERKKKGWLIVGVLIFLVGLVWLGINSIPEKSYHCHKNGYLFETMNKEKTIFTKTDIECIYINDISFRSSIKEIK